MHLSEQFAVDKPYLLTSELNPTDQWMCCVSLDSCTAFRPNAF